MTEVQNNIGIHILLDLYECDDSLINDATKIEEVGMQIILDSNLSLLKSVSHQFTPQGATALFLLTESHVSIHTWPEKKVVACDIFCCTDRQTLEQAKQKAAMAARKLTQVFGSKREQTQLIIR